MALAYVTVTGTWDDGSGQAVTGTATFTPSEAVYSSGQQLVTPAAPVSCPIVDGHLTTASGGPVQLLATDNTGLTLLGRTGFWLWSVSVNIGGGSAGQADEFSFFLPYSGSPVDLYSLANQVLSDFPNPLTALGDLMVGGAGGSPERLAGNATTAREFLISQGTGTAAQAETWGPLQAGDIPSLPYLASAGNGSQLTGITAAQVGAASTGALSSEETARANADTALGNSISALADEAGQPSGLATLDGSGHVPPGQLVAANIPTLNQSTTGTAANLSGTPALPNGTTATTQTGGDSSTKVATDAFVATAAAAAQAAAITASLPTLAQASASASATLAVNTVTTVTAATALTMTLPTSVTGALIVVERESASAASVAVTGSIRGVGAQTVTLSLASESEMFLGSGGSWWPVAGHKTLGSLDGRYQVTLAAPSGDTSGATDTAAIQAAENALSAAGGGTLIWHGGSTPYYVTGLVKQAGTIWQGAGRFATIIQLANGANGDVVQGANFSTLTLSGSVTGGIGGWGIRDMTIDGNKANQSGTSYGLRLYGYEFDLTRVSIRNCLTDGLYTEWGKFGNPSPDKAMSAAYTSLNIHDNNGNGWLNRGPHDSRAWDVTIFGNGSGASNYWGQSCAIAAKVAAGSNGVDVATFTGSGTLNVATTLGYPAASISGTQGSLTVATSAGTAVITYAGITATTFTGCTTVSGSGTLSTNGSVSATGPYSADGQMMEGLHCYDPSPTVNYQMLLDATTLVTGSVSESAIVGSILMRGPNCTFVGSAIIDSNVSKPCFGLSLGDTVNPAFGCLVQGTISGIGSTSASNASLVIGGDTGSNSVELLITAPSGATTVVTGSPNSQSHYRVSVNNLSSFAANAAPSFGQLIGSQFTAVPQGDTTAWTVNQANAGDVLNLDTSANVLTHNNGVLERWWSGNYSGIKVEISGPTGRVSPVYLSPFGLTGATTASRLVGAVSGAAPAAGTWVTGDWVTDVTGGFWICTAGGTPGTWAKAGVLDAAASDIAASPGTAAAGSTGKAADAGHVHGPPPVFAPAGLTGATAASRYAGATASGAPASGTFAVGDFVVTQAGNIYVCTVAGSPGTWVKHGQIDATASDIQPVGTTASAGSTGKAADAGHVHLGALALPSFTTKSGAYIAGQNGLSTSATLVNGNLRLAPLIVGAACTIAAIGAEFTVAGDANSVFRMAVYADDGTFYPGALLLDGGSISTGAGNAGTVSTGGTPGVYMNTGVTPTALPPGIYWVGGAVQGVTVTQPTVRTASFMGNAGAVSGVPGAGATFSGYLQSSVTGTPPGTFAVFASSTASAILPRVIIKLQ